jgi:hypothetical protein
MPPQRIRGRCLCGGFQFEIIEPVGDVRLCHCDLCRRASGTAFPPTREFRLNDTVSLPERI